MILNTFNSRKYRDRRRGTKNRPPYARPPVTKAPSRGNGGSGNEDVPNHCYFRGNRYNCGLSLSCVFSGSKALDLCNGGMVWSCCVPRSRVNSEDEEIYGAIEVVRGQFYFLSHTSIE